MNTDRYYWVPMDPVNLAEGFFAVANIFSFTRICFLLPANQQLGPLQISLGNMISVIQKKWIDLWIEFDSNLVYNLHFILLGHYKICFHLHDRLLGFCVRLEQSLLVLSVLDEKGRSNIGRSRRANNCRAKLWNVIKNRFKSFMCNSFVFFLF